MVLKNVLDQFSIKKRKPIFGDGVEVHLSIKIKK